MCLYRQQVFTAGCPTHPAGDRTAARRGPVGPAELPAILADYDRRGREDDRMRIGFGLPVSGAWATPVNVAAFAERAEALGYDSLWTFQRLLVGADQHLDPVYRS